MALLRDLSADRQPLETFRSQVPKIATGARSFTGHPLNLHLFEWSHGEHNGSERADLTSLEELETRSPSTVRVVFAPQDVPAPATLDGLCELFERYKIPSAFIAESLRGVSQSFSVQKVSNTTYVWFHFLCKDIAISKGKIFHDRGPEAVLDRQHDGRLRAQIQSQANFTWLKPGFVLKIRELPSSPPLPSRTTTSSSDSTLVPATLQPDVELFCFGAPVTIRDRFRRLKDLVTSEDILKDPFLLLEAIVDEMHKKLDQTGWAISEIFGEIETHTLDMAKTPGKVTRQELDFQGLHNLAKHVIYLQENCESALATLEDLQEYHDMTTAKRPSTSQAFTKQAMKYQRTLIQSTQRRLASLNARIANVVQLSFHIVTQGDSRLMQSENQSMKTIAVMTLIFMPLSTIAGIFGTQFMKLDDGPGHHMTVSQDFWLLWVIAAPLTVIVLIIWRVWYRDAKKRLTDEIPRDAKRGLGWKTLRHKQEESSRHEKGQYSVVTREVSPDAKV